MQPQSFQQQVFEPIMKGEYRVYQSQGLKLLRISEFPEIATDPTTCARMFRGLRFVCPVWNPNPFDHVGGKPQSEDPYPIFCGVRKLRPLKQSPSYNLAQFVRQINKIEQSSGARAACQTRVIFHLLINQQYDIAFPNSDKYPPLTEVVGSTLTRLCALFWQSSAAIRSSSSKLAR